MVCDCSAILAQRNRPPSSAIVVFVDSSALSLSLFASTRVAYESTNLFPNLPPSLTLDPQSPVPRFVPQPRRPQQHRPIPSLRPVLLLGPHGLPCSIKVPLQCEALNLKLKCSFLTLISKDSLIRGFHGYYCTYGCTTANMRGQVRIEKFVVVQSVHQ